MLWRLFKAWRPAVEKDFGADLEVFEQQPEQTKELEKLADEAEKTTGPESAKVQQVIREISKEETPRQSELPL
jgi:hypothetical protein